MISALRMAPACGRATVSGVMFITPMHNKNDVKMRGLRILYEVGAGTWSPNCLCSNPFPNKPVLQALNNPSSIFLSCLRYLVPTSAACIKESRWICMDPLDLSSFSKVYVPMHFPCSCLSRRSQPAPRAAAASGYATTPPGIPQVTHQVISSPDQQIFLLPLCPAGSCISQRHPLSRRSRKFLQ